MEQLRTEERPTAGNDRGEEFDMNLVYGEASGDELARLLSLPEAEEAAANRPCFIDIGCGTGKAMAAAAASGRFREVVGIEIVDSLVADARQRLGKASEVLPGWTVVAPDAPSDPSQPSAPPTTPGHGGEADSRALDSPEVGTAAGGGVDGAGSPDVRLTVHLGDALAAPPISAGKKLPGIVPWARSGVVFVASTAFSFRSMQRLARAAERMKPGAVLLTTTNELKSPLFELVRSIEGVEMSWGRCTVHLQRRKRLGRWVAGVLGRRR